MANSTGQATVFGFAGNVTVVGIGAPTVLDSPKTGGSFGHNFQVDRLLDGNNNIIGYIASQGIYTVTLDFIPVDASGSLAAAALEMGPVAKLAKVTLAGFVTVGSDVLNSAKWVFVGPWEQGFTNTGTATYRFTIERPDDDSDLTTATSA